MKLTTTKKIILACLLAGISIAGGVYFYYSAITAQGSIYEFDESRDTQPILDLFKKDYYWLVEGVYNPEAMLKYRSPGGSPLKKGQMHIKVLRPYFAEASSDAEAMADRSKGGGATQFVGFVAYYKKLGGEWKFNFIAVDEKFRGKGYAQQLMQYALDDMKRMGAKKITLVTRTSNTSAQKLYNRMGFAETYRDDGYVYFEYRVN